MFITPNVIRARFISSMLIIPDVIRTRFLFSMFIIPNVIRARFICSMLIIPDVIQLVSSFLCSLSRIIFGPGLSLLCSLPQMLFNSFPLFYVYYPEYYSVRFLFSMFITANVIRSLFHCLIGQFFNCSPKLGCEGVQRNALRVQRPKSPHSEEIAQT